MPGAVLRVDNYKFYGYQIIFVKYVFIPMMLTPVPGILTPFQS